MPLREWQGEVKRKTFFNSPQLGSDTGYVVDRLINNSFAAEGSNLPPVIGRAQLRVQPPTNFRILKQSEESGQTRIILQWFEPPEMLKWNPVYMIFVDDDTMSRPWADNQSLLSTNRSNQFSAVSTAERSPTTVIIPGSVPRLVRFRIATRLANGMQSSINDLSPSVSAYCLPLS